ncbi:MAG: hypothetical protein ACRBN8_44900 [Nannocystales bacterium]
MLKAQLILILALCGASACIETTFTPNPDYCGQHDGNAYCARVSPQTPFCVLSTDSCYDQAELEVGGFGCVAQNPPEECRQECGIGNGDECDPTDPTVASSSTSTGGETEPTSTTVESETETDEPSETTGPECSETVPCMDPAAPFCVDGACSTCDATETPDESCVMLDEALPLCVGTSCVQCTAEDSSACGGETPLCDAAINTCVGCSFHEECQDIDLHACNIATGACFSADAANVSEVDAGNNGAIQAAIGAVADGAEHTILLTGGGGNHTVTVDGGKTIAIVSDSTAEREIRGAGGNPTVTVTGAGSTVYLHRLELIANTDDVGISTEASGTLYADSTRVAQNTGGGITLAAGTSGFLRNCMVAGDGGNSSAISSSGTLSVVYSTLGRDTNFGDPVLECSGGSTTVRNSIIVSQTNAPGTEVDCPGVSLSNGDERATQTPEDWFGAGFASGNYFLNAVGQAEFADIAIWEDGDPPFDFDGDTRPNTDGAMDYAGADTIP